MRGPVDPGDAPPGAGEEMDADTRHAYQQLSSMRRARNLRRLWRMLPSPPRCKLCHGPFSGPFVPVLRAIGKGRWPNNPNYCGGCFRAIRERREGAEIESTFLFADVRGSTEMAERMRPSEVRRVMDRFFSVASERLIRHEAIIDKFVGDEVVAIFIPGLTGGEHAAKGLAAGREILAATAPDGDAPLPVGIGVNTGVAYVGAVGTDEHVELTAVGDAVNVAARLASAAGAGELVASRSTVLRAGVPDIGLEHRTLTLKGKSEAVEAVVFGPKR